MTADDAFDAAPCGLAALDADGVFLRANRALASWLGCEAGELVGVARFADILEGGAEKFSTLCAALDRLGSLDRAEIFLRGPNDVFLPAEANFSRSDDGARKNVAIFLRAPRAGVQRRQNAIEHLSAIVAGSADAIVSVDRFGRAFDANPAFCALFGYSGGEIAGADLGDLIAPGAEREKFRQKLETAALGPIKGQFVRRRRKDGALVELSLSTAPIYADDGELAAVGVIYRNLAPLTRAAEQIEFLLREVHHRSKNFLAVAQAVARQSASAETDPKIFAENFSARLAALGAVHDLLLEQRGRGPSAGALAERFLAELSADQRARVAVEGGALELRDRAAEALGLALRELIGCAGQAGALTDPRGVVDLSFGVDAAGKDFVLRWRESGAGAGPPPGFGEKILSRLTPLALGGAARLDQGAANFVYEFRAPADEILSG